MSGSNLTPAEHEAIAELLLTAEEMLERGEEPSPVELCHRQPRLLVEFTRKWAALRATQWLNRPLDSKPNLGPVPAGSDRLQANRVLAGRYRLERILGEGGHGQVWRAWDNQLGRAVALKVPKTVGEKADKATLAEARRIAGLKHPGIVQVHDIGQDGDIRFIVTDLVEGGSLADLPATKGYSIRQVLGWLAEVADALDYAHRMGVVHRDIKPANILLDHHGRALLADFGISRSPSDQAGIPGNTSFSGTLRYMAPEQVLGLAVTPQADIHALGVVLHELLTGNLPYSLAADADPAVLRSEIVAGTRNLAEGLPAPVQAICSRALQVEPMRRQASAAEFARELRACQKGKTGRGKLTAMVGMLGLLGLGAVFTLPRPEDSASASHPVVRTRPMDAAWLEKTRGLEAPALIAEVVEALRKRNPDFDGVVETGVENGVVRRLKICTDTVADIAPLAALPDLEDLKLVGTYTSKRNGKLADISPLKGMKLKRFECFFNDDLTEIKALAGMPLEFLQCSSNGVSDLSPIAGAPLRELWSGGTPLRSLEPVRGMPLEVLWCNKTKVVDLSPLAGAPLKHLRCQDTQLASLEPLASCPLETMECHRTEIRSVAPLRGMKTLQVLNIHSTRVDDLAPLLECKNLKILWCSIVPERDKPVLSKMTWLTHLNDNSLADFRFRIP